MAFRSRIKLFFRPAGLTGNPNDAVQALTWSRIPGGVKATNPTPYYVSLVTVNMSTTGKKNQAPGNMIAPKSSLNFTFPGMTAPPGGSKLDTEFVNDYGAVKNISFDIK